MANSSFAVWSKNQDIDIDLHINCWIFEKDKDVIDFGLMISNSKEDDEIFFYIPFYIEEKDIENLTETVEDNVSLRSLIFNEELKTDDRYVNTGPNCKFYRREDGEIFSFCLNEYIYKDNYDNGIKLTFKINNNTRDVNTYFRFRLKNIKNERIFKRNIRQVSTLTGVNEEYLNIELNINQFRKLSTKLQTNISSPQGFFTRINMFLMTDIDLTPVFSTHSEKPKTRILEDADRWRQYINLEKEKRYLAYQYKKQDIKEKTRQRFKSFTIFSKFEQVQASVNIKKVAFIFIFLIGVASSSFVTIIATLLGSVFFSEDFDEKLEYKKIFLDTNKSINLIQQKLNKIDSIIQKDAKFILSIDKNISKLEQSSLNAENSTIKRKKFDDVKKVMENKETNSTIIVKNGLHEENE